ncbi:MAG TPA: bifunctional phosphoribosylaminoimidazolecarboxamide formyltransferase/IMP cyclohydrolase, partial [Thermomicrobiaceae bacterium]|nr:bifunctional phosphoribosylaminoimidazolecarboxamide formyltransferase/IMP cyclohydrolase [Thermomicrobiaceae bacterium]
GRHAGAAGWNVRHGKEMSFNNYLDANAAWTAAYDFADPTVVIVKHTGPCGIASADALSRAYELALASDPVSAFGGVVALNRSVDLTTAQLIAKHHFDIVMAPAFDDDAYARLRRKRDLRLIEVDSPAFEADPALPFDIRMLDGAFLAQSPDRAAPDPSSWRTVTSRQPTSEQLESMAFAWQAVRYVKSNAILLAQGRATVGIGGGQPNRVDSVRIAAERAGDRARGSVLASDALFPFPDNIEVAAEAGVSAIIQPGGSVKDAEVIAAAEAAGIAMVFTGIRHFRH